MNRLTLETGRRQEVLPVDDLHSLQLRQRSLLNEWLQASNGEARFRILQELRSVELELNEMLRRNHRDSTHLHQYAMSR